MPVLMSTLIESLASTSSERRQVAGRSLGELVRKLGERVLPSIIPILAKGLENDVPSTRQGVCMGLSEVMASAGKHQLVVYMGELIPTIRTALCDKYVSHTACFWVLIFSLRSFSISVNVVGQGSLCLHVSSVR
jgi:hypothetical protein